MKVMGHVLKNIKHRLILCIIAMMLIPLAQAEYADVIINKRAEKEGMRPVIFPHWFHRVRFTCNACHNNEGFKMRVGANDITMAKLVDGKFCGMCHNNEIAWGLDRCDTCHSGLPSLTPAIKRDEPTRGPGFL